MIIEKTATAATIEEAIAAAKTALNAPFDAEIKYDIIQMPQKKTLGLFGGKDAEVRVYYELPGPEDKKETPEKNETKAKPAETPAKETKTEKKDNPAPAANEPEVKAAAQPKAVPAKSEKSAQAKQKPAKKQEAPAPEIPAPEPVEDESFAPVIKYLSDILANMDLGDFEIKTLKYAANDEIILSVTSSEETNSFLIGRHGDTLDNLQYLVRLFANKHCSEDTHFSIDVGGYRVNREAKLRAIAARQAAIVRKTGRQIKLDPMNPYERRIIHTTIQGIEGVTSFSVGHDKGRRVIISLEEGVEPERPRRGGGNSRQNFNRGNRGSYNRNSAGYNKNYSDSTRNQNRPPRYDNAGTRYGKITPKTNNEKN
ncbi:MAG: Jag N-terminal domain-containing protein [Clostridia bacterium]|nr:Jag N-terminal domain-containing protein [Clostridia bacterium]